MIRWRGGMTGEVRTRDAARAQAAANAGPLPANQLSALAATWLPAEQIARQRQAAERVEAMAAAEARPRVHDGVT
jgi:hypothetical protein